MTIEVHDRRLGRVERRSGATGDVWFAAVYAIHWQREAALAMAAFAQALAGTDKVRAPARVEAPAESFAGQTPLELPSAAPRRKSRGRVWDKNNRPGPHDTLTWEEAMRYFSTIANTPDGDPACGVVEAPPLPADPGRPQDPWENWGFIRPSYDEQE